ncbi:Biphenyl dioxygenase ferredoxin subunit [Acaryochloris thomasi RCC1774]|uniref:Biphenyl dioxygenase ferredoxin subunit n=1 Tax=Acaryochloris thomasi RCC1774 TaxID=1764569 RepID=A0A2W1JJE2_9CYAN|nr:Rieske (2Fe-2S) protein [Acaryochloris thomasi]PZD73356.1 Biphenyl dioxygenase ferredoxin subunit [Acaryochloris thomasi RCC1774]
MSWEKAVSQNELAQEGARQVVKISQKKVVLLNHQGEIYAVENSCPHIKAPMSKGKVVDGTIVCPFHRSVFDLKTGAVQDWCPFPPGVGKLFGKIKSETALAVFPTRIEDGSVWVDIGT